MTPLIDGYDAALFDLDGVVYLGPLAIDGVPASLEALRRRGVRVGFVTNNAARTPAMVARHLTDLGVTAEVGDVVNSTQAMVRILRAELPAGARLLVLGTHALVEQAEEAGFRTVASADDQPDAVLQGYNPSTSWDLLEQGAIAIQNGARWFATNPDLTRPTERGILPGCGAQVAVVQACVGVVPTMAGKPFRPLLDETVLRLGARKPIFVGDRTDTDIMGANGVGMESLFVFTGAHGFADLAVAPPEGRPTHIGWDTTALLQPARSLARPDGDIYVCGLAVVALDEDGVAHLDDVPASDREAQLDAAWALLNAHWDTGADISAARGLLTEIP